jgi:hypothetical protein
VLFKLYRLYRAVDLLPEFYGTAFVQTIEAATESMNITCWYGVKPKKNALLDGIKRPKSLETENPSFPPPPPLPQAGLWGNISKDDLEIQSKILKRVLIPIEDPTSFKMARKWFRGSRDYIAENTEQWIHRPMQKLEIILTREAIMQAENEIKRKAETAEEATLSTSASSLGDKSQAKKKRQKKKRQKKT